MAAPVPRSLHLPLPKPSGDWIARATDVLVAVSNSRPLRWVSESFWALLLRFGRRLPTEKLENWVRCYLTCDSTCAAPPDTPSRRFTSFYFKHFGARTMDRARRYLAQTPPAQAAIRIDRFLRLLLVAELRAIARRYGASRRSPLPAILNQVQLALYPHCDLRCEGCYTEEDRSGQPPTRQQMLWLVDQAESCGAYIIHVVGKGEPFLSASWAEEFLSVVAARPHLFFSVVTHGMRITPQQAERIGKLGNLLVLVSMDGPQPIHDARRGAGSFERVKQTLSVLREHGVLFGYSATVSSRSQRAIVAAEFYEDLADAGCSVGMYSRYFPLSPAHSDTLALSAAELREYEQAFQRARDGASIPLLDLDDIESSTGCHSRAGESVHIDGVSMAVTPCIRVPFAASSCRLDPESGRGLREVLLHPFFVEYRRRTGPCPSHCGADLAGELASVERILNHADPVALRLAAYRERSPSSAGPPRRRLPVLQS
jgi:sulfatase maturation enzyme AslB (radical SAM superfamily)